MAEFEHERLGAIDILRINRPEARNALTPGILVAIGRHIAEADADPDVRAIILTGAGDRAFCAGLDLKGFASGDGERGTATAMANFSRFLRDGAAKPTIAAANGAAVAGGFELVMACDLVVAADGARFGLAEVKRGLFAAGGGLFISTRIPLARALELTLTGDLIDAQDALALGLINQVVPVSQVMDASVALAERIIANGPLAVDATKRIVRAAATQPPDEVWALHDQLRPVVFESEDAKEGAAAFVERRPPVWKGR